MLRTSACKWPAQGGFYTSTTRNYAWPACGVLQRTGLPRGRGNRKFYPGLQLMDRTEEQVLALAGIAQSAFLVHQLAHHGLAAQDKFTTVVNSLFITHPKTTADVYGGISNLQLGLKVLQELLEGSSSIFNHA